jgi:hypothetical protein
MAEFLNEKRQEITRRLDQLRPLVEEYHLLEQAATALAGVSGASPSTTRSRAASTGARLGRPRGSKTRRKAVVAATAAPKASARRGGRPKGSGSRSLQAMELVTANPGITIPELAGKMKIKATYLYRVLPPLKKEGKVRKSGRNWYPVA